MRVGDRIRATALHCAAAVSGVWARIPVERDAGVSQVRQSQALVRMALQNRANATAVVMQTASAPPAKANPLDSVSPEIKERMVRESAHF